MDRELLRRLQVRVVPLHLEVMRDASVQQEAILGPTGDFKFLVLANVVNTPGEAVRCVPLLVQLYRDGIHAPWPVDDLPPYTHKHA